MMTHTKIKLEGINHIAINVKDMDRAEAFYSEVLGFSVIQRSKTRSGFQHIEVDVGNDMAIALFETPDLDLQAAHKTMTDDGYLHFAFGAPYDRFDATLQALKTKGVEMDGEPRDWGKSVSVYFRDPDGYQLEINFSK